VPVVSSGRAFELSERELGRVVGQEAGPTLVAIAGMHGNEPAGIVAARRVLRRLESGGITLRGELIVLAGNLEALRRGARYQTKDLNRQWTDARIAELRALPPSALDAEDREQLELLAAIEGAGARARGPLHLIDMHTSSASGIPFVMFGDTPAQRRFVGGFRIPVIMGLEGLIDGVLSQYWTRQGWVTFAVEGGQHDDPSSVDSLEAVMWQSLAEAGLIDSQAADDVQRSVALLEQRRDGLPRVLEVVSRRSISSEDGFVMEPGFRNIDRARKGQLLARDARGEIRAPHDGLVILPLYQGLGSDGYFWGRALGELAP